VIAGRVLCIQIAIGSCSKEKKRGELRDLPQRLGEFTHP
jgi:hypothetical protein